MKAGIEKDASLEALVQAEKLKLLYQQSFVAVFGNFFSALLLVIVLWPVQQHHVLLAWLAVIVFITVLRMILFTRYRNIQPDGLEILAWKRPYIITLLLASVAWGFGAVYIMPAGSMLHQAIIYYFLMGMSGGAVAAYSSQRGITLMTIGCVLLPATVWLLMSGSATFVIMAIAAMLFIIAVLRAGKVMSDTMHDSFLLAHELKKAKEKAENIAELDELTGLGNRRAFYRAGSTFIEHSKRTNDSLSMIVMDMDHFKIINDSHGHAAGDDALTHIGRLLRTNVRNSDVCARVGGEEFGILLPSTTLDGAVNLAEKLRRTIEGAPLIFDQDEIPMTASFGVSSGNASLDDLFRDADAALYEAKAAGRNLVMYQQASH
jgi:diguanylate cyclase (GGDEF)-like protein